MGEQKKQTTYIHLGCIFSWNKSVARPRAPSAGPSPWDKVSSTTPSVMASDEATTGALQVPFFLGCSSLTAGAALLVAAITFSVTTAPCQIKPTLGKYCRPPILVHQLLSSLGTLTHEEWEKQRGTLLCHYEPDHDGPSSNILQHGKWEVFCASTDGLWRSTEDGVERKALLLCSLQHWPQRSNECVVRSTEDGTMKMQRPWGKINFWKGVILICTNECFLTCKLKGLT